MPSILRGATLALFGSAAIAQNIPCFESNFGQSYVLADDAGTGALQLGFTFNYGGQAYSSIDICSNGFFWLGAPAATNPWDYSPTVAELNSAAGARICPLWDDLNPSLPGSGQVWFNAIPAAGANPARAVVTYDHVMEYGGTNALTFQVQLVADGRIYFYYDASITGVFGGSFNQYEVVGMSPGNAAAANSVDWSTLPIAMSGPVAHEQFTSGTFDLSGRIFEFLPSGAGYGVANRPACGQASFVRYGHGCPHDFTIYQLFPTGPGNLALSNQSLMWLNAGNGYVCVPGPALDTSYTNAISIGDDVVRPGEPLGFPFPFAGQIYTNVDACSNGFLWMGTNPASQPGVQSGLLVGGTTPRIAGLWHDLDPASGGQVYIDAGTGYWMMTWVNVPQWSQTNQNTMQIKLLASGTIIMSYGQVSLPAYAGIVGISQANGAADLGSFDLFGSLPFEVGSPGDVPIDLAAGAGSRPALGSTFRMDVTNIPAGTGLGAIVYAFGQANVMLGPLGMNTCRQYVNLSASSASVFVVGGATHTITLGIPGNAGLIGLAFDTQAVTFTPAANPFGVITTNGGRLTIGL
jgi:hypothetical protein